MNYKKAWITLKAESGYRTTKNFINQDTEQLQELMDRMEERIRR